MVDRSGVTFSAFFSDWTELFYAPLLIFIISDSSGIPKAWSMEAYGIPASPILWFLLLGVACRFFLWLWRWKTSIAVGDGSVEVKSVFSRRRFDLTGAKLEYTPLSLLLYGSVLVQTDGKRSFLPLPTSTDKKPLRQFAFFWLLSERGLDLRSDAIRQFKDQRGKAEGVSYDPVGGWKILVPGLTGFCLMFVPELVWFAAGQKPLLPVWLNWVIFACGFVGAVSFLFPRRSQREPVPKNGIVIEEGSVTLKKDGSDLWTAPFEDLRIEVTRSQGNLINETLFKAFSKDLPLKIPDKFDHWPFDGEDVACSLLRLGVRVDISDEVWEMNT